MVSNKIKILIVEHELRDIDLLEHELKKGRIDFVSQIVENEKQYCESLNTFIPDIILCDYSLPSFDGALAFRIREKVAPETPFIFISGAIGDAYSTQFVENGVTDYALKDKLFTISTKVKRALKESGDRRLKRSAELKLVVSEGKLARAQELAHVGSWELNFATNVLTLSDEGCRIFGFQSDRCHLTFEIWSSQVHPNDIDGVMQTIKGSRDTLSDASFYYRFVLADNSVRYIYSENKFEFDPQGKPIGLYGIIQDITERKGEEQKLRKANRLYAFISQINQSIVHLKSEEALYSNSCRIAIEFGKFKMAWIGMFDREKKIRLVEQAGMPDDGTQLFSGILCEDNNPQEYVLKTGGYYVCNHIEKLFEHETWKPLAARQGICSLMVLPIRRSGVIIGTFNLYANEINFFDTKEIALLEEVTGDISFAIDIFEKVKIHRATEEQIIRNEKRFRALIEKSSDMKTLTNQSGGFIYCSPSVLKVFGYSQEEFLLKSIEDLLHPDDIQIVIKNRTDILKTPGKSFTFQYRLLNKSGSWIWCEGTTTNMLQEPGVLAFVSNFMDISERKSGEADREKMIEDITKRNITLEQFTYIVSHNLRAPIAKILGLASIMESDSAENNFLIEKVVEETHALDNVVRDINTIVSGRKSDKEKMEPAFFETKLNQVRQVLETEIKESNALITTNFSEGTEVFTVKGYLYSIFYNLISNAIKYRLSEVPLRIHIKSIKDGKFMCLSVSDNGSGIDLVKNGSKIFGLYKRFHGDAIPGRGIGLNLVKTHIESMGGRVEVASKVNEGTTFKIYIPISHANIAA
jgi:PAS domain S-box-containing protein